MHQPLKTIDFLTIIISHFSLKTFEKKCSINFTMRSRPHQKGLSAKWRSIQMQGQCCIERNRLNYSFKIN